MNRITALLIIATLCPAAPSAQTELPSIYGEYEVLWGNSRAADATITLSSPDNTSENIRHSKVLLKPKGLMRMFADELTVEDWFVLDYSDMQSAQVATKVPGTYKIRPLRVEFKKKGRIYESYRFEHDAIKVLREKKEYRLSSEHDALSLIMLIVRMMAQPPDEGASNGYRVAWRGKVREYVLTHRGSGQLQTALGRLETEIVDWERRGEARYRYWLSRTHHNLPVRVARLNKSGRFIYEIVIKKASLR